MSSRSSTERIGGGIGQGRGSASPQLARRGKSRGAASRRDRGSFEPQAAARLPSRPFSNACGCFILVLTILSLLVIVVIVLPIERLDLGMLQFYDVICCLFLIDFALGPRPRNPKSHLFQRRAGWLDLLGSIPSFGITFRSAGLLRLSRLGRLARISRCWAARKAPRRPRRRRRHRGQYAGFITILFAMIVLHGERTRSRSKAIRRTGNITVGWNGVLVQDGHDHDGGLRRFLAGRRRVEITGMFIMFAGRRIIGALASILASLLVGGGASEEEAEPVPSSTGAESGPRFASSCRSCGRCSSGSRRAARRRS